MKYFFLLLNLFLMIQLAQANHIFATQIEYQCLGNSNYAVKVSLFTECGTTTLSGSLPLLANSNSCSQLGINSMLRLDTAASGEMVTPLCANFQASAICNGGGLPSELVLIYRDTIQLPMECPDWIISVSPNIRSSFFTNLVNPATTNIYVEALIDNSFGGCYHSPAFRNAPMLYACAGERYTKDMGAFDWEGDTIRYSLVAPKDNNGTPVNFQTGLSANQPLSVATGTSFVLDETTGQLTFTPRGGQSQVAAFVIKADKYHQGKIVASTIRELDIQSNNFCSNASLAIGETSIIGNASVQYDDQQKAFIGCPNSLVFKTGVRDWNGDSVQLDASNTNVNSVLGSGNVSLFRQVIQSDSIELMINIATPVPLMNPNTIERTIIQIGLTDEACPFESRRVAQFITFPHFLKVSASQDIICANSPQTLQLGVTGTGSLSNIKWSPYGNTDTTLVVSNDSISNPTVSLPALTGGTVLQYEVTANIDADSCAQNVRQLLTIRVLENPTIAKQVTNASTSVSTDGEVVTMVSGNLTQFRYDWNDGSTDANQSNLTVGDYVVTVTDYYGCSTVDTTNITFGSSITKIDEATLEWSVYPNPSQNKQVYLQTTIQNPLSLGELVDLSVFNSLGQLVYTKVVSLTPQIQLDFNRLPEGNYWLQIRTKDRYVTKKIRLE